jgi:MacB-like periplasmic core domain
MRFLQRFFIRLVNTMTGRRDDARLNDEIEEHLALETAENIRRGMSPAEARRQARLKFGAVEAIKEEYRSERRMLFIETLFQDIHYALRMIRKSPGFTAVTVLTIALGVGATTGIFSVVDATLLQPLPYPHPKQLVSIQSDLPEISAHDVGMSQPEWQDLQQSGIFEYVSPTWFDENNLTGSAEPARVRLLTAAPNYFALLRAKPELGRTFDPQYHSPGFIPEVLISDGLWKRDFARRPADLGKKRAVRYRPVPHCRRNAARFRFARSNRGRTKHRGLDGHKFLRAAAQ